MTQEPTDGYADTFDFRLQYSARSLLLEPAEILEKLIPIAEFEEHFSDLTEQNAKDHVIASALIEVQKVGFAFMRWRELSTKWAEQGYELLDNEVDSVVYEQSALQRKLAEILTALILFSRTNESTYYFHLLAIRDLIHLHDEHGDWKDFHAVDRKDITTQINDLHRTISRIGKGVDTTKCWYLSGGLGGAPEKRPRLTTFRQLLIEALSIAGDREHTALGYKYSHASARSSQRLHYNPRIVSQSDNTTALNDFKFLCSQIWMLGAATIVRCQQLSGIHLPSGLANLGFGSHQISSNTSGHRDPQIGDMVAIIPVGQLGEIVEIRQKFRNSSCRIMILEPPDSTLELWELPGNLRLYRPAGEIRASYEWFAREHPELLSRLRFEGWQASYRLAAIEVWRSGASHFFTSVQ